MRHMARNPRYLRPTAGQAGTAAWVAVGKMGAGNLLMGSGRVLGLVEEVVVETAAEEEEAGTVVVAVAAALYGWPPTVYNLQLTRRWLQVLQVAQ